MRKILVILLLFISCFSLSFTHGDSYMDQSSLKKSEQSIDGAPYFYIICDEGVYLISYEKYLPSRHFQIRYRKAMFAANYPSKPSIFRRDIKRVAFATNGVLYTFGAVVFTKICGICKLTFCPAMCKILYSVYIFSEV